MEQKTFKEKYVDLKWDANLCLTLITEFIATITFIFGIMNLVQLGGGAAFVGFAIASIATVVIYAFGPRCGAPFNPAIVAGLMVAGKINLIQGT